ncbi:MAG: hypothetical protein WCK96_02770 [Methylococcales bacterium]
MKNEPRTVREALIAEILGDLDTLIFRIEALPVLVTDAEEKISNTIFALEKAGDQYRMMITDFTEQAKTELAEYLDNQTRENFTKITVEQREVIQEAVLIALGSANSKKNTRLIFTLNKGIKELHRAKWIRLIEISSIALISSSITAGLVYMTIKGIA